MTRTIIRHQFVCCLHMIKIICKSKISWFYAFSRWLELEIKDTQNIQQLQVDSIQSTVCRKIQSLLKPWVYLYPVGGLIKNPHMLILVRESD